MAVEGFEYQKYSDMSEEERKHADKQLFGAYTEVLSPFQEGRIFTLLCDGYNRKGDKDLPSVTIKDDTGYEAVLWLTTFLKKDTEYQTHTPIMNTSSVNTAFLDAIRGKGEITNLEVRELFSNLVKDKQLLVTRRHFTASRRDKTTGAEFGVASSIIGFDFI